MDAQNEDLTYQLPRDLYYQVIHTLRAALPPPVTDTPEDLTRRDNAAVAQVASLLPANGEEALLAAQYIAANAQALDCLRLVRAHPRDIRTGLQCMAQAASMMRQARSARSLLMRIQMQRQKREANPAATDSADWVEHCAIGLMSDALQPAQPPSTAPQAAPEPEAPAPAQPAHRPASARNTAPIRRLPDAGPGPAAHREPNRPNPLPHAPEQLRRVRDGPAAKAA